MSKKYLKIDEYKQRGDWHKIWSLIEEKSPDFLEAYLKGDRDVLTIQGSTQKISNIDIKDAIEAFIAKNVNDYNFPEVYL